VKFQFATTIPIAKPMTAQNPMMKIASFLDIKDLLLIVRNSPDDACGPMSYLRLHYEDEGNQHSQ
jgi:hypothetical protein